MKDKGVGELIVGYRVKCDFALSDRDEGVINQEEYEEAIKFNLNRSKETLHSLLISKLPEKRPDFIHTSEHEDIDSPFARGYNKAIDDMREVMDELFKVEE